VDDIRSNTHFAGPLNIFLGYEIKFNVRCLALVESVGIWPWKWIEVSRGFYQLSPRMQRAVLLHELGHIYALHQEKRILRFLDALFRPEKFREMCHNQEHDADRFATQLGFGDELCRLYAALKEQDYPGAELYPSLQSRIQRILEA